jgi:cysteinyl-tRNA synthetase
MLAVLGLDPLDSHWGNDQGSDDVLEALVENVLALRGRAKSEKDFGLSDALRAALDQSGIDVQDEPTNSTWSIRG